MVICDKEVNNNKTMKKQIYLVLLLLAFFLAAGFSCGKSEEAKTEEGTSALEDSDGSLIGDFKDALKLKKKMMCTYKVSDQGQAYEHTSYVEGEKYRTEYSAAGVDYTSIFDGKTMYTWDENTKQGTKMDMTCLEDLQAVTEDESADEADYEEYQSSEDMLNTGLNVSCRQVSAIDFSVPKDVQFVDQCALLKQQMESLENLQEQLPDLQGLDF